MYVLVTSADCVREDHNIKSRNLSCSCGLQIYSSPRNKVQWSGARPAFCLSCTSSTGWCSNLLLSWRTDSKAMLKEVMVYGCIRLHQGLELDGSPPTINICPTSIYRDIDILHFFVEEIFYCNAFNNKCCFAQMLLINKVCLIVDIDKNSAFQHLYQIV